MDEVKSNDKLPYDYVEQDQEYLDYLATIATQEMEAEYLPNESEHGEMLHFCESILESRTKVIVPVNQNQNHVDSEIIDVKITDDGKESDHQENPDYNQYLEILHNETLADILIKIEEVDLIETLKKKIGDPLYKYQDQYGQVKPLQVPNNLYMVAIMHELHEVLENNGWGFAYNNYSLYVYTKTFWQKIDIDKLKRFLNIATIKLGFYSPSDATSSTFINSLLKQYQAQVPIYETTNTKKTVLINLKNGTFEINNNGADFREHRKRDFVKHILPYEYDSDAKAPIFKKYLERVLPDKESQLLLQEFHGYIFTRHLKLEKALILYGTGSNGKSVMYEITTALLGKDNVSTKSFGDLIDSDSGNANRASLQNKLLNFGSEIGSKKNMTLDIFKKLVSGEAITARQKYEKSIDIDGFCKFIFNANTLPDIKESTEAYYRRLLVIPYEQRILEEEQDPELEQKIINNELPGIFNWVLEGLERLLVAKKFSKCKASDDVIEDYKVIGNPIALFLEEKELTSDYAKENKVTNKEIYAAFEEWRKLHGIAKVEGTTLSKRLISMDFKPWKSGSVRGFHISGDIKKFK